MALLSFFLGNAWQPAFDETLRDDERGTVAIAPTDEALTLARRTASDGPRVIAVTRWQDGVVEAVDLSAVAGKPVTDAPALFRERGYDALRADIDNAPSTARVTLAAGELLLPVDFGAHHVAVGTNYPEHAADAGTTRPFLFPKLVQPTRSGDNVSAGDGLLDYEVEIAVLPLEPLSGAAAPHYLGLLVANDFTDRDTLLRLADRSDIESGKGFTTGKSMPGFLPVGSLLVIPRDWRTFVPTIELRLFVNGRLRQRSPASEMVWDTEAILSHTIAAKGVTWKHRGADVPLFPGDSLPALTLVLTGTPAGTVIDGIPPVVIAAGLVRWAFGGWSRGIQDSVADAYADAAREAGAYLKPGDEVLIHVQRLGQILSPVVR